MRESNSNISIIEMVTQSLGELKDDVVFLGGAVCELLISDKASPPARPTKDIDIVIEAVSLADYYGFCEKLKRHGFTQCVEEDSPICRWLIQKVKCDFMPTKGDILGFSNRWFKEATLKSIKFKLPSGTLINLITAPYFLATKFDAYEDRGKRDFDGSADIDDIIYVLDGRESVVQEIERSSDDLKQYLAQMAGKILNRKNYEQDISGHLYSDKVSQARVPKIVKTLRAIANL